MHLKRPGISGRLVAVSCAVVMACSSHGSGGAPDASTDAHRVNGDAGHPRRDGGAVDARADAKPDAGTDSGIHEALDPTVATNLAFSSQFLYAGPNPVQTGVAAGTIDLTRASVVRGQISVASAASDATTGTAPLAGVTVTVLGHPEYGQTTTQADGWYSMVVNGGGLVTMSYAKAGYLPVQRRAVTRWLEYAIAQPAVLIAPEPGTQVTLSSSSTSFQIVRGKTHGTASTMTPTEDADGARTATVLIPPGTTASIAGLNEVATTLHATEFTTGALGLQAMPGDLPPTSTYTYAVDLSIDEANGQPVTFSQPVLFYVDNFIGFPVGDGTSPTTVPAGSYDTTRGLWVPSPSGEVVKVLTNASGTVTLDTTGSGQDTPDTAFTPPLVSGERAQIASLYTTGATFWRVAIPHFTGWDLNWGSGPPDGAVTPDNGPAVTDNPDDSSCETTGSIIECENQILAEQFPLAGTPYGLRYQSERAPGRQVTLQIPITGATPLPSVVTGIDTILQTQGRQWTFHSTSLAANQFVSWTWDRTDAYGRLINGHSDVSVSVGYDYQTSSSYQATGAFGESGNGTPITGNRALREITIWQYSTIPIDQIDASTTFGLGGLSLTAQHLYDPFGQTFYGGDGTRRTVDGNHFTTITTYAGGGTGEGSGVAATSVDLSPSHIAMGADGTLYIAEQGDVRAVAPKTRVITTIAGNGMTEANTSGNPGDGQAATSVAVSAYGMGVGSDGTVYVTTAYTNRVRSIDPTTGIITTVAGNGGAAETCTTGTPCSDGQAATSVPLASLGGVAVGPDGCVYFTEQFGSGIGGRARKIELNGTLTTVMDNLSDPDGLAFGPDGSLYVVDTTGSAVYRLTPSGTLSVVAGGSRGYSGDGGPATQAELFYPIDVAIDDDGSFYISDSLNDVVRLVDTSGVIHTITNPNASTLATSQVTDDNGPAGAASLEAPVGLVLGPGHALYIADSDHDRVRVIRPPLPGFSLADAIIPSPDGTVVYQFDETGKHQHTFDALRGQTLATMAYTASGLLASVTDNAGNVTTFNHSDPTKVVITAPFGQTTTLNLDGTGYATSVVNPNQETVGLTWGNTNGTENGLLATLTDPKGQVHHFDYTPTGLLSEDDNPAGGVRTLVRSNATGTGWTVTHQTKMGYVSQYVVSAPTASDWERDVTDPTGATSSYVEGVDGSRTTTWNDLTGTPLKTTMLQLGPDPRYAMIAPIASSVTTTLEPSGLAMTTTHTRTATVGSSFFDLSSQVDVVTVNPADPHPQVTTTTYTAGSSGNTRVTQTAMGRTRTETLDANDRVVAVAIPGLATTTFAYNTAPCPAGGEGCGGRLTSVTATTPNDGTRTWTQHYQYSPDTGFSSSAVDPMSQTTAWLRDPVGRIVQTQLPDLPSTTASENQIHTTYDLNGNVSTIAVPSAASPAPTHSFPLYSGVDDLETYTPPALTPPLATSSTQYTYNFDRQLTQIQVPEGSGTQTVTQTYDAMGRVQTVIDSLVGVTTTSTYEPGGLRQSLATSDGETLTYGHGADGSLVMSRAWTGLVKGTLTYTHDDFFRVASRAVNGGTPLALLYDADGLFV